MNSYRPVRLHYLCSAVCGGHATEEELEELGQILEIDRAARQTYIQHLDLHATLSELGPLKLNSGKTTSREVVACPGRRQLHSQPPGWLYGIAAMVLVSLLTWHFVTRGNRDGNNSIVSNRQGTLNVGELSIDSGTLQMKLPGVGVLVADGPVNMELESPMRLRVDSGRVKLRVTEETGHGFVVSTPHGDVTDLGTEFAVDVGDLNGTNLVVFDGKVDLSIPRISGDPIIERLVGGEAVRFARTGQLDRIMSIFTDSLVPSNRVGFEASSVIVNVSDNLPSGDTKRFYEIVPRGFDEDKAAYVDRPYEWNGVTKEGLPKYLVGGDYIRTFNSHKGLDFQLTVEVSRPCDLYVLWDKRGHLAPWLEESFQKKDELVGLDEFVYPGRELKDRNRGIGPGNSVGQQFIVWHQRIVEAGKIVLGSIPSSKSGRSMYGVVAVPWADDNELPHRFDASRVSVAAID